MEKDLREKWVVGASLEGHYHPVYVDKASDGSSAPSSPNLAFIVSRRLCDCLSCRREKSLLRIFSSGIWAWHTTARLGNLPRFGASTAIVPTDRKCILFQVSHGKCVPPLNLRIVRSCNKSYTWSTIQMSAAYAAIHIFPRWVFV